MGFIRVNSAVMVIQYKMPSGTGSNGALLVRPCLDLLAESSSWVNCWELIMSLIQEHRGM